VLLEKGNREEGKDEVGRRSESIRQRKKERKREGRNEERRRRRRNEAEKELDVEGSRGRKLTASGRRREERLAHRDDRALTCSEHPTSKLRRVYGRTGNWTYLFFPSQLWTFLIDWTLRGKGGM
jgi:hypothetical protein